MGRASAVAPLFVAWLLACDDHDAASRSPHDAALPDRADDADGPRGARDAAAASGETCTPRPSQAPASVHRWFAIRVLDQADHTPVVGAVLTTTGGIRLRSDRHGNVAFYEPGLMDGDVYFTPTHPGYELAADGFGFRGKALRTSEGASAEILLRKTASAPAGDADDRETRKLAGPVPGARDCFALRVLDARSGRGVPLAFVTIAGETLTSDSQGMVALCEPDWLNREQTIRIASHGYRASEPVRRTLVAGEATTLSIVREQVASRLTRLTGQGIFRDSLLLGLQTPLREPALNGQVIGQDTVNSAVHRGRQIWVWGDTNRPSYPLGLFRTAGAWTEPPRGPSDPCASIDYHYFTGSDGFVRPMVAELAPTSAPTWLGALVSLPDVRGNAQLFAVYGKPRSDLTLLRAGLVRFDDASETFVDTGITYPVDAPRIPAGQPLIVRHVGGDYAYFAAPLRVPARAEALLDPSRYETWSARLDDTSEALARSPEGAPAYAFRRAPPTRLADLTAAGFDARWSLEGHACDADTLAPVQLAGPGAQRYSARRGRFLRIVQQQGGSSSFLGELWLFEADTPLGPWVYGRKVVSHDDYTFYNPWLHPERDREDGRFIAFEATYTKSFAGDRTPPTPRYDYNQILYELDLDDPRLALPVAVYDLAAPLPGRFVTKRQLGNDATPRAPLFYAREHASPTSIPIGWNADGTTLVPHGAPVLFHALPADVAARPAGLVPLYAFAHPDGRRAHGLADARLPAGFARVEPPIALVWPSPLRVPLPVGSFAAP